MQTVNDEQYKIFNIHAQDPCIQNYHSFVNYQILMILYCSYDSDDGHLSLDISDD